MVELSPLRPRLAGIGEQMISVLPAVAEEFGKLLVQFRRAEGKETRPSCLIGIPVPILEAYELHERSKGREVPCNPDSWFPCDDRFFCMMRLSAPDSAEEYYGLMWDDVRFTLSRPGSKDHNAALAGASRFYRLACRAGALLPHDVTNRDLGHYSPYGFWWDFVFQYWDYRAQGTSVWMEV